MINQFATNANQSEKESMPRAEVLLDSEPAQQPELPRPSYKPYTEEPTAPEPYRPYAEKPALSEPPYKPYKDI